MSTAASAEFAGTPSFDRFPRPRIDDSATSAAAHRVSLVVRHSDGPPTGTLESLSWLGYQVLETEPANALRVVAEFEPLLIVALLSPRHTESCHCLEDLARASDAPLIAIGQARQGMAEALLAGADAFLADDDGRAVLIAQVASLARRQARSGSEHAASLEAVSLLKVDEGGYRASLRGQALRLTPTEFEILAYLYRHIGEVCPSEAIVQAVGGLRESGGHAREVLKTYIFRLRRELRRVDPGADLIANVWGIGYRLERPPA